MDVLEIIEAKKRGQALGRDDLAWLIEGYTRGDVPDYQMSAWLMAVWFRGMTEGETADLAGVMLASGEQLDTDNLPAPTADKHSTGGVGDKVSLLLAPLAAACGLNVPMLSGRGLGHTGGTLDKLQAVPGYRIHMSNEEFLRITGEVGCAIVGQSPTIAPADGRIYALRDVTGTVDCVPLITASIMSKKLAAGPRTIVIDLKTGSGAFMPDLKRAHDLARALMAVGKAHGRRMAVVFSDMDQPLGRMIGHAHEAIEAFAALRPGGRGTAPADLVELTVELVARMVQCSGLAADVETAREGVCAAWDDGRAWERLERWLTAQGGRIDADREDLGLETAPLAGEVTAARAGWLAGTDCRQLGLALADLGGARRRVDDPLDPTCGIEFLPRIGDRVERGDTLARIYTGAAELAGTAGDRLTAALRWSEQSVPPRNVVLDQLA